MCAQPAPIWGSGGIGKGVGKGVGNQHVWPPEYFRKSVGHRGMTPGRPNVVIPMEMLVVIIAKPGNSLGNIDGGIS